MSIMRIDQKLQQEIGFFFTVFSLMMMTSALFYIMVIGTAVWSHALNRWNVVFPTFLFMFIGLIGAEFFAIKQYQTMLGKLISLLLILGMGVFIIIYYLSQEKFWCIDFPAYNRVVSFGALFPGVVAVLINLFLIFNRQSLVVNLPKITRLVFLGWIGTCLTLMGLFSINWGDPNYRITVPADGEGQPMHFSFWSHINTSYYTPEQWEALNNHSAIIIAYSYADYDSETQSYNFHFEDTFMWAQFLRDNYPNIKLMWPVFGGYYELDYYVNHTYTYLNAIIDYNLNNTIGFVYDLERHNDTCSHDATLLQQSYDLLQQCIGAIKLVNSSYRIDNTGGIWMMFDKLPLGGSFELYKQHTLMAVTQWDGYQWQLYRGNAVDPASDPYSTDIFERMLSSVEYLGTEHTIPLFGMTGVGDYGPNNCTVDGLDCNFAGVIKDCQIARALGISEVSFFTLCDAGINSGVYYPSMFEAYGEDFLDILNQSVNGLSAPLELVIPGNIAFKSTVGYWWENVSYSISLGVCEILFLIPNVLTIYIFKRKKWINNN